MRTFRFPSTLSNLKASTAVIAILAAGIVIRLVGLTASGIWYDESLSFHLAQLPLLKMMEVTAYTFNPPLWGMVLWVSLRVFGANEFGLRIVSLLASIVSLWLVNKLCDEFKFTDVQKILILLFAAFLPGQLWMAQDGRIYALMSLLFLGAVWFALRKRWLGLTACSGLLLYAHSAGAFYAIAAYLLAFLVTWPNKKQLFKVVLSGILAVISFVPWLPVYLFTLGHEFSLPPVSLVYILQVFYHLIFVTRTAVSLPAYLRLIAIASSLALALLLNIKTLIGFVILKIAPGKLHSAKTQEEYPERYIQIMVMLFIPFLFLLFISLGWKSIIYYRPLSALLVPMIFWLVVSLSQVPFARILKWVLLPLWVVLLFIGLVGWSPAAKSGELREVAALINDQWQEGDIVYHITGTSLLPFSHYVEGKPTYLLDEELHNWLLPYPLQDAFGLERAALEDLTYRRVWVVFARDDLIPPGAYQRAETYIEGGTLVGLVESWQFAPVEVYLVDPSK